jgi:hypothetical protein
MAPNREPMKNRMVRTGPEWEAAQAKAAERGEVLAEEIRKFLISYASQK